MSVSRLLRALPAVTSFADGTVVYVLSRMWADLLTFYVVPLHPLPYCEFDDVNPCADHAEAWAQWDLLGAFASVGVDLLASLR